jgi:integrase
MVEKGGTEVPGVSFHRETGQFYSIPAKGQRDYLGKDLTFVVRKYLLREGSLDVGSVVTAMDILDEADVAPEVVEGLPDDVKTQLDSHVSWQVPGLIDWIEENKDTNPTARHLYNDMMVKTGYPEKQLPPLATRQAASPREEQTKQRLRDVVRVWEQHKAEENCRATYVRGIRAVFDRFVGLVGNKLLSELNADDLARWRRWIIRNGVGKSNKWMNDQNRKVQTVLLAVKREKPLWPFPDGLKEWTAAWQTRTYVASRNNRRVLPAEGVNGLLTVVREWQQANPEVYSKDTQRGRAQRRQARDKQHEGLRWEAIIRLAVNCALDNVDCRTIRWEHLKLSDPVPHMDFPRSKVKKMTGLEVDRLTPLLPSTVEALRAYREVQPYDGVVFRTARGGPCSHNAFRAAFNKLLEQAGIEGFTFKHLRNIAPTLGRRHKLSRDERDAILGHVVEGTSKFYEDGIDASYLVDLVNLVGREYFGGEQIDAPGQAQDR